MPEPLAAFLALVAIVCIAILAAGVLVDHERHQRKLRLDEIRRTPSPFEGAFEVVGGHRGPGGDR